MSKELVWLINGFSNAFNVSGNKSTITKHSKKAGTYSKKVSTDTSKNLQSSAVKVGNAMRKAVANA